MIIEFMITTAIYLILFTFNISLIFASYMSTTFYKLVVKEVKKETQDCVSVSFNIPAELKDIFTYKSGQYLTLNAIINNVAVRRSYSICSAPQEADLRVAIKQVEAGVFSTHANTALKAGDTIEVMPPNGHFGVTIHQPNTNYIGFASGSGITPILSIVKDVLHANESATFTLVYGNKNVGSIIFKEELEALKNIYINRFRLIHILSREHQEVMRNNGRINAEKCTELFTSVLNIKQYSEAYICGPESMTLEVKDYLIKNGMPSKHVKFELFGTGASTAAKKIVAATPTGPISKVSIKVDDRTFDIDLAYDGLNILDAALANGADLPFACKGGVCCTCRAKVVEGQVKMTINYALEEDEVAAGFVLSCQAHPITDRVVIDFDVR